MGEVGECKDNMNKIFMLMKKDLNLDLMAKKEIVAYGREAYTLYTQIQSADRRLVQKNILPI